jgi:hypothetical protein
MDSAKILIIVTCVVTMAISEGSSSPVSQLSSSPPPTLPTTSRTTTKITYS